MEKYKVTQQEIAQNNVKSAADKIDGSPQDNKHIFDKLPELIAEKLNGFIEEVGKNYYTKEDITTIISDSIIEAGAGDMTKGVYDRNNSGVVDDAERLGGELPGYYAPAANLKMKIYNGMGDLGLDASATFADTVAAVPNYAMVFLQVTSTLDASWNLPITLGQIQITRRWANRQASVTAFSSLGEMYIATLDTNGVPTGVWNKVVKQPDLAAYMPIAGGEFTGVSKAVSSQMSGPYIRNSRVTSKEGTGGSYNVATNNIVFRRKV